MFARTHRTDATTTTAGLSTIARTSLPLRNFKIGADHFGLGEATSFWPQRGAARFVRANQERLVLKPNDQYGGHGVYLGPHLDQTAWENAIEVALSSDYVVEEAVDLSPEHFPIFNETNWNLQPMFVDTNPFLFLGSVCGAMVRLSSSPIVNVTSGGSEAGFFLIQ